jgi:glycosyltransferase involved in cell wall biosynthesis
MMSGVPGVVSRVGDLADLVEDGTNGYLVDDRTPEAFAARIIDLLADPERLSRFAEGARQTALKVERAATTRRWDTILDFGDSARGDRVS